VRNRELHDDSLKRSFIFLFHEQQPLEVFKNLNDITSIKSFVDYQMPKGNYSAPTENVFFKKLILLYINTRIYLILIGIGFRRTEPIFNRIE
jgi:hypothetical protein